MDLMSFFNEDYALFLGLFGFFTFMMYFIFTKGQMKKILKAKRKPKMDWIISLRYSEYELENTAILYCELTPLKTDAYANIRNQYNKREIETSYAINM